METPPHSSCPTSSATPRRAWTWLGAALLVIAGLAAYHNCYRVPFLYDDAPAIVTNPTIRQLWPLSVPLNAPKDATTEGRPVLNLSFALNYATSGLRLGPLHATNVLIHLLSGLALFGLMKRTLQASLFDDKVRHHATALGLASASLWLLHPLQTQSVTYLVQRAESLMSLFYLLTLYCFVRSTAVRAPGRWLAGSVAACALGMGSKEVMVSAPIIVLLYDRTFVAGSFAAAWRARRAYYAVLAATWIILALAVASTGGVRGGSAGFNSGMPWWVYSLTQLKAITHYLRLAFWPSPLVFDYGIVTVQQVREVLVQGLLIVGLVGGTLWALAKKPVAGFFAFWFFALLAPSSSVVPVVTETMAEHRMYLPLAGVVCLSCLGLFRLFGPRLFGAVALASVLLGVATERRNRDYQTSVGLWTDTVAKQPGNARGYNNLGLAYHQANQPTDALAAYETALRLKPDNPENHYNVGNALVAAGRPGDALSHFDRAIALRPNYPDAHSNRGQALMMTGRLNDALNAFREAIRLKPNESVTHNNLGITLGQLGQLPEALAAFGEAVRLAPRFAEAHSNLGFGLKLSGRPEEAITSFRRALEIDPEYPMALTHLAQTLSAVGRHREALPYLETVTRLEPSYPDRHYELGQARAAAGQRDKAIAALRECLRLQPDHGQAAALLRQLRDGQPPASLHTSP